MGHQAKHSLKSWRGKAALGLGAAGVATAALTLTPGVASASSFGCNAQASCATLNGHQADGAFASMDARYQEANQIVIGYPDNLLDKATSFDKVPHTFRHGALHGDTYYTFVYAPTGDWSNMCVTAGTAGLLSLQVCTHGNSTDQQFVAGQVSTQGNGSVTAPAVIPNFDGNREYVLENVGGLGLGNISNIPSNPADIRLMEDTYSGSATHPSPNIPRNSLPDARQLDVNGGVSNNEVTLTSPTVTHMGTAGHHLTFTLHGVTVKSNAQWNWHT